jgi:glycosyltransferase involved in cell wall biosynthesis
LSVHVLLYSRPFYPATGGIETVSLTLAEQITAAGHRCTVVTETKADETKADETKADETKADETKARAFPFMIERAPSQQRRLALAREADIVHSNGASLAMFFHARLACRPFLWTHGGYQMVSVDGMGWVDDAPAPLSPLPSILLHARRHGALRAAVEAAKLALRMAVGRLVDRNVAITHWVARRQPLPRQVVIYNPFPLARFAKALRPPGRPRYDFLYVGRLVSEKGVSTLLKALALLNRRPGHRPATLLVVGDGERRAALEELARTLGVAAQAHFGGTLRDAALVEAISEGEIAIVPSEWEEPMGGVALELLAAGKPLIVSERGGMIECVGDVAWNFPNGDAPALAERMAAVLDDETLRRSKGDRAAAVLARFDEKKLTREYLDLYEEILRERG